jgi:Nif-specific regulatory protein
VKDFARYDISVLLTGPSGTGKSAVAKVIHRNSPRALKPLIELNCSHLNEGGLAESELFGHKKGAFTGATSERQGKISAAEGGTLFLDEVGEIPLAVQAKLLTFLDTGGYYPAGGDQRREANVRLIAATNKALEREISLGRFREDLFHRLKVVTIRIPPLSERREDIKPLAEYFCEEACRKNHLPALSLSPEALRAAEIAEWAGNIRELANAVQVAALRAAGKSAQVERWHLFPPSAPARERLSWHEATRQFHRQLLAETLRETNWNKEEARRLLGISHTHVHNLIKELELKRPDGGG